MVTEQTSTPKLNVVPPRILRSEPHSDPNACFKSLMYPSHAGIQHVIVMVKKRLGLSNRALDMLLGVPREDAGLYTWKWLNGVRRPSPVYLSRMLVLVDLSIDGHPLVTWKRIDWDTGEIELRESRGKNGRVQFVPGRNLSNFKSPTRL